MEIRKMTIGDYEKVYDLWMSCKNMGFNDVDDSREGIEKYLRRNPDTSFVAEDEGLIAGVILGGHDGRRGFIHHACVRESYRHQGIGRKLVEHGTPVFVFVNKMDQPGSDRAGILEALKKEGISKVALLVFKYNEAGNGFWEACGFTVREDLNYRNLALRELVRIDT